MDVSTAGLGGYGVALASIIAAWWNAHRKSDVDQSGIVFSQWEKLIAAHQADMSAMRSEFAAYKASAAAEFAAYKTEATAEIGALRERVRVLEDDNRRLKEENAGLKRAIAQNSQSTAMQLGRVTPPEARVVADAATGKGKGVK